MARRARIVLLAAEGMINRDIAALVDLHYNQVGMWRGRYAQGRSPLGRAVLAHRPTGMAFGDPEAIDEHGHGSAATLRGQKFAVMRLGSVIPAGRA